MLQNKTIMPAMALSLALSIPANAQTNSADTQAWQRALGTGNIAGFETYLQQFPAGQYAGLAFRCTIELALLHDIQECSAARGDIGPAGPVRSQIGQFSVTLK